MCGGGASTDELDVRGVSVSVCECVSADPSLSVLRVDTGLSCGGSGLVGAFRDLAAADVAAGGDGEAAAAADADCRRCGLGGGAGFLVASDSDGGGDCIESEKGVKVAVPRCGWVWVVLQIAIAGSVADRVGRGGFCGARAGRGGGEECCVGGGLAGCDEVVEVRGWGRSAGDEEEDNDDDAIRGREEDLVGGGAKEHSGADQPPRVIAGL